MRSSHGMVSLAPILAIAGLVGLGATGYRMISGTCPFSCGGATACSIPVAATGASDESCSGCCDSGENTIAVSQTEAAPKESCCSEAEVPACCSESAEPKATTEPAVTASSGN